MVAIIFTVSIKYSFPPTNPINMNFLHVYTNIDIYCAEQVDIGPSLEKVKLVKLPSIILVDLDQLRKTRSYQVPV